MTKELKNFNEKIKSIKDIENNKDNEKIKLLIENMTTFRLFDKYFLNKLVFILRVITFVMVACFYFYNENKFLLIISGVIFLFSVFIGKEFNNSMNKNVLNSIEEYNTHIKTHKYKELLKIDNIINISPNIGLTLSDILISNVYKEEKFCQRDEIQFLKKLKIKKAGKKSLFKSLIIKMIEVNIKYFFVLEQKNNCNGCLDNAMVYFDIYDNKFYIIHDMLFSENNNKKEFIKNIEEITNKKYIIPYCFSSKNVEDLKIEHEYMKKIKMVFEDLNIFLKSMPAKIREENLSVEMESIEKKLNTGLRKVKI